MKRTFLVSLVATFFLSTAATACTYKQVEPVVEDGETKYRFFNECGFYEVGYRLVGNALHFPRGGVHAIRDVSVAKAQSLLAEIYGLVDVGEEALVRTKGLFLTPG